MHDRSSGERLNAVRVVEQLGLQLGGDLLNELVRVVGVADEVRHGAWASIRETRFNRRPTDAKPRASLT